MIVQFASLSHNMMSLLQTVRIKASRTDIGDSGRGIPQWRTDSQLMHRIKMTHDENSLWRYSRLMKPNWEKTQGKTQNPKGGL